MRQRGHQLPVPSRGRRSRLSGSGVDGQASRPVLSPVQRGRRMSLVDQIEVMSKRQELKILVYDIERMKGSASVEFWSLSDFKNRRIHADDVTAWPRTICVA